MDNNSPFLVEFVVTIEQAIYIMCKMICRCVVSLTSYIIRVDYPLEKHICMWRPLRYLPGDLNENIIIIIIIIRLLAILSIIQYSIPFLSLPVVRK
jgi:hypothetical protein